MMPFKPLRIKNPKPPATAMVPQKTLSKSLIKIQQSDLLDMGQGDLVPAVKTCLPTRAPVPAGTDNSTLTVHSQNQKTLSTSIIPLSQQITGDVKMKIMLTDPMTSDCLAADVSPSKTASECIQAMKQHDFLGSGIYQLVVNGKVMLPNQTFAEAGVTEGDTVTIHKMEQGA